MGAGLQSSRSEADLRHTLDEVAAVLERHRVLDSLAHRQDTPNRDVVEQLQRRQNLVDMQRRVHALHPADLAFILESLPQEDRLLLWAEIDDRHAAETLVELDSAVRDALIGATKRQRLTGIVKELDLHDIAWLSEALPEDVMREVSGSLERGDQTLLQESMAYPEHSVGHLMTREVAAVRDTQTVAEVLSDLRTRPELPTDLDRLFVVDARHILRGALSLQALILGQPGDPVAALMTPDPTAFRPEDNAAQAARAFDRYDLLSAPVVTERGKLAGRLTVDAVMDFVRVTADADALAMAGLRGGEDLFASVWQSAQNRWPWLFLNLVTAFVASRFIGLFEATIQQLVALATLMPVVASIGGNTGNQTVALVDSRARVRSAAAVQQTPPASQGADGQSLERTDVGWSRGSVCRARLSSAVARHRHGGRRPLEPRHRRVRGRRRSTWIAAPGPRPGPGCQRTADVRHRLHGLPVVSGAGSALLIGPHKDRRSKGGETSI